MAWIEKGSWNSPQKIIRVGIEHRTRCKFQRTCAFMPLLKYLADTNVISDYLKQKPAVVEFVDRYPDEIAISTFVLAEMRRGIELRPDGKARSELERQFQFVLEDYQGAVFVFDGAAATEWGRLMAEARNHPIPFADSLSGAMARSTGIKMLTRNIRHDPGCETVDPWTGLEYPAWKPF